MARLVCLELVPFARVNIRSCGWPGHIRSDHSRSRSLPDAPWISLCSTVWFGLAHLTAFVVASSVVAFPVGFAAVLPGSVVLGGVLLVTLLYFAIADFLYMGRLAAYVAMVEMPDVPVSVQIAPPPLPQPGSHLDPGIQSSPVDASELILSDVSASS